jgi:hypothetical protein
MFLEFMSTMLIKNREESGRVMPVAEMFDHIGSENKVYRALRDSGRLHDFYELAQGYFARGIEQRLRDSGRVRQNELNARSHMVAASLLGLLRWWLDHGGKEPPKAMDELFHRAVWDGV